MKTGLPVLSVKWVEKERYDYSDLTIKYAYLPKPQTCLLKLAIRSKRLTKNQLNR